MSRQEAVNQYKAALKAGKNCVADQSAKGLDPYLPVLDELPSYSHTASQVRIGLVDIPTSQIVGTFSSGRQQAFAANFMPLLDADSEFAYKWIALCQIQLDEAGFRDPVKAYEYMGKFYIQEGNKRVSVLKSFDSPEIPGNVIRILPQPDDSPDYQLYQEFLDFYRITRLYHLSFTKKGSYQKLLSLLDGSSPEPWTEEKRKHFLQIFYRCSSAFQLENSEKLPLSEADALLAYLQLHPFTELEDSTEKTIRENLALLWPDMRLLAEGEPICLKAGPEPAKKPLITKLFGKTPLKAAFLYDTDPRTSPWASAHQKGQQHVEQVFGPELPVSSYICEGSADEKMEQAIAEGANVIFATSPTLIGACRRSAALHKQVTIFNCSLSFPYADVRSYYCRIYEGKFIAGAIAGAMASNGLIGYTANYPVMGVPASINAFTLGARMTNPRSHISLRWSCLPGNPLQELIDGGASVVSNRDADGASPYLAWENGTFQVQPDGTLEPLASPVWNWSAFYERTLRDLMQSGIPSRSEEIAVNNWWGLSTGMVDIELSPSLPSGVKQLALLLKDSIIRGTFDPFLRPIHDQTGARKSDGTHSFTPEELMRMDWLCSDVEGSIPSFEELLPQSRNLVKLLGTNREKELS